MITFARIPSLGVAPGVAVRGGPVLPVAHPLVGDTGNQQRSAGKGIRPGQHVHHFARCHKLPAHLLDVDQRRLPGDRDRLLELADGQLRVHLQRGVAGEGEPLADDGLKSREGEGDRVIAGPEVGDREAAGAVGDGAELALDEHGAGRVNRHARQDATCCVRDLAGDRAAGLRQRHRRQKQCKRAESNQADEPTAHVLPPGGPVVARPQGVATIPRITSSRTPQWSLRIRHGAQSGRVHAKFT
jgi:hypothetical protein